MALNINWRFADPQNINVPQSNILPAFNKNIKEFAEIKKAFEKKADDKEMMRMMTEDAESELASLIERQNKFKLQYDPLLNSMTYTEKADYENKLNELDVQINSAMKKVDDARMSANQFKTTGTTDFFRWKKDKEYDLEKTAMNQAMLDEQIKAEKLSQLAAEKKDNLDKLSTEIKLKEKELRRSTSQKERDQITDELNILMENYNKLYGEEFYKITGNVPGETPSKTAVVTPTATVVTGNDGRQPVKIINGWINDLKWEEDLDNSKAVKDIQDEIDKYDVRSDEYKELNDALISKIKALNEAKKEELAAAKAAALAAAKAAAKAAEKIKENLATLRSRFNAAELLDFYTDKNKKNDPYRDIAKAYLIEVLAKAEPDLLDNPRTAIVAARRIYGKTADMNNFIDNKINAINKAAPKQYQMKVK